MAKSKGDGRFAAGLVVGYFAGLLSPALARALPDLIRPVAKFALKGALLGWDRSREAVALVLETLEDVVAEVKSEVDAEMTARRSQSGSADPGADGEPAINTFVSGLAASAEMAAEQGA